MRTLCLICFTLLCNGYVFAQKTTPLDEAVASDNWKEVAKLITREISGTKLPAGKYNETFDSLIARFKTYACITDAEWTKCGAKILIYPGQETIAIKFKTANGEVEKIFPYIATAYHITHRRVLGLSFPIKNPIEQKALHATDMEDSKNESRIEQMRNACARDIEQKKIMAHHAKVFFTAKIIGGVDQRSFPPLNFNCTKRPVKIHFSATNNTEDTLRIYWPNNTFKSDPLFRISFYSYKPNLNLIEDTLVYQQNYRVVVLPPKGTITSLQYLYAKAIENERVTHLFSQADLDAFTSNSTKNGSCRIGFSSVNNGLSWQEDPIWKPAEPVYIFQLGSYVLTDACE